MIGEHDTVVLKQDVPDAGLKAGDVGTIVLVHNGGEGFEVEFVTLSGATVSVVTVEADAVRPADPREISHARKVA
ncbi:MAG: DUF4926 domain-containing protein [Rhodospirillaceae bacterium]|nr:DUF4926 domain-containing protein [Rhodospirillaceae bacterium]